MDKKSIKAMKRFFGKNLIALFYRSLFFLSDEAYIKFIYRLRMGKRLNLSSPVTFNEKLQWLKLNDRKDVYTQMADKLSVRNYIDERIGSGHTVPVLGVYRSAEEIDFRSLPSSFVLKTTHDSGSYVICSDKSKFDRSKAEKKLTLSLGRNYYRTTREWQYRNIRPFIIAEEYLGESLTDYKFFVFNGKAKFMYMEKEASSHPQQAIYDMDFCRLPFTMDDDPAEENFVKPEFFDEMREYAEKLSADVPFLRVDMYHVGGKTYVGELTFYHYGGFIPFNPPEWDEIIGGWLKIN